MIKRIEQYPIITIILVVLIMLFFSFPFLEVSIMEARNFISAREMITDGNWLLTTMNGEPRYQKPPLPTWLAALSGLIFGIKNTMAFRLPGILMVMVIGISSFFISKELTKNTQHALVNALIVITSFYVLAIVIEAPWDIFTHGFMLLGIYKLFQLFKYRKHCWTYGLLSGVFIGLSILCKGPISIYALFLPFLFAYGIAYRFVRIKEIILPLLCAILIALIIGGWWYLYVRLNDPITFLQIATKETANWSSYNIRPFYYYWSFFVQSGIWTIPAFVSLIYPYMKSRVSDLKAYRLTLFWTIIAVILLSIIPEKKSRYLMPVLIPLALNTGFYIEYLFRNFKELKGKETSIVYFNFGLISIIGLSFGMVGYFYLRGFSNLNWMLFVIAALALFLISLFILFKLKSDNIQQVFYLTILFVITAFVFITPLSKELKSNNYKNISFLGNQISQTEVKIYSFNYIAPEMIWHFGDKLPKIKLNDSTYKFPAEKSFGMLANDISSKDRLFIEKNYSIKALDTFDLNIVDHSSKQYKNRLMSIYYRLTKK